MINWLYLRWQLRRNAPLFLAIALPISALGLWGAERVPLTFRSTATILLEQAPGDTQTARPRPGDAAPERLRVIAQKVVAAPQIENIRAALDAPIAADDLSLSVTAGREKATLLTIEANAVTPSLALALNKQVVTAVRTAYEDSLRARLSKSGTEAKALVSSLSDGVDDLDARLVLARGVVGLLPDGAEAQMGERLRQISIVERQQETYNASIPLGPEQIRLQAELDRALTVFTKSHPKVVLLTQELAALSTQTLGTNTPLDLDQIAQEKAQLSARLQQVQSARQDLSALRSEHASALRDLAQAQRDQTRLQRQTEARFTQEAALLSVIAAPTLPTSPTLPSPSLARFVAVFFAVLLAAGACWLRWRTDHVIHRSQDLERHLGITPFATLPQQQPLPA